MKREEFIREKKDISREELLKIAEDIRHKTEKPFPEELEKKFHSLDREVLCKEEYVNTAFGNTHIFIIRPGNVAPDEITPVVSMFMAEDGRCTIMKETCILEKELQ